MITKLTLRSLAAHKLRLSLTAVAVILGVAFVTGTLIFSSTVEQTLSTLFAAAGKGADTVVRPQEAFGGGVTDAATSRSIPGSLVTKVEAVSGVAKVHGSVNGFAAVVNKDGKLIDSPRHVGVEWVTDEDFAITEITSGQPPRTPTEIAIDATTAKTTGYRVGDRIQVALQSGSETFTLAGIFDYGDSGVSSGAAVTAFEPATAQKLLMEKPDTYTDLAVHARDGVSQEKLRDAVRAVLPAGLEAVTGKQAIEEEAASVKDLLGVLRTFLLAFAVIALFVGSFIIFNTFSMLVAQRTRDLALLRAVGASRGQVTRSVLGEAFGVGILGSVLGLGAGAGLALLLRLIFRAIGVKLPGGNLVIPGVAVFWAFAVGMVVTLVAAYLPGRRAARVPPVAALREGVALPAQSLRVRLIIGGVTTAIGVALGGFGLAGAESTALTLTGVGAIVFFIGVTMLSPVLSRPLTGFLAWPFARLFGAVGLLSRENAKRNPLRTASTASALMIGLALVGAVSVLAASVSSSVNRQLDAGLRADFQVTGQNAIPFTPAVRDAVVKTSGVQSAVATRVASVKLGDEVETATAGTPAELVGLYRLDVEDGGSDLGTDELLIDRNVARDKKWTVGTMVSGEYQDGKATTFRVAGIYGADKTVVAATPAIILGIDSYRSHDPSTLVDQLDVVLQPGTDAASAETALKAALLPWPNLFLRDRTEIKAQFTTNIDLLLSLVLVLLVLSVVIAALGIVNTLALSVIERTREIGLLRAVGMHRRQLRRMIRYESVVISTFGAVLGLGIGVLFGWALQRAMSGSGVTELSVPFGQIAAYTVAGALIGVIAAIWPARRAARMDILSAISTR